MTTFDVLSMPPPPEVEHLVAGAWSCEKAPTPGARTTYDEILPAAINSLCYSYGGPVIFRDAQGQHHQLPRLYLVGAYSEMCAVLPMGHMRLAGIRLWPGALHCLGLEEPRFRNRIAPLSTIDTPQRFRRLEQHIRGAGDPFEMIRCLYDWLSDYHPPLRYAPTTEMVEFSRQAFQSRGQDSVQAISDRLSCSRRSLELKMRHQLGFAPKQLTRIYRFQHLFHLLRADEQVTWKRLASASGFSDQSHLVREFKAITGATPNAYVRAPHPMARNIAGRFFSDDPDGLPGDS